MPFDIPDNDVAFDTDQSIWMSTDIDILTAGLAGVGVVSGCEVTAQGSPDMTVAIAAGVVRVASGLLIPVTAGNGTITTADATNPRIDLVSVSDTGTKTVTAGTAAANPKAPALPSGHVALAMVYVPQNDTTIASTQITDKRVLLPQWSKMGWVPYVAPYGLSSTMTVTTAAAMVANGGSEAVNVFLPAWMELESVTVRNGNTSLERKWGWDLYQQDYRNNVLNRVAASSADETFTASAASDRTITVASAPVILPPGHYWIVIQNRHASNTFQLNHAAAGTMSIPSNQNKTTTNPNGATLDFTAATWLKGSGAIPGLYLHGRVFGESTAY